MRLGLNVGYSGSKMTLPMELVLECEQLGFHSAWTAEAYGSDAVSPAAWILARTTTLHVGTAIMQAPARTPANAAMTAMTLDHLSDGRFLCGVGASGPQVVEGFHGVRYGNPMTRVREYVAILRQVWAREAPLEFDGKLHQIPYRGDGATGLGKPLKSILHGRPIPIYVAAIGPKSVAQVAEIAEGWLPIFYSPYRDIYADSLHEGFAKAGGGKSLETFDVAPSVIVVQGDDAQACRDFVKPILALYVGGMGAKGKNFYHDLACRYGFEEAAGKIQDLYLDGKKAEAIAQVPDELVDEVALCGPAERIQDRLAPWKECGVTTLICGLQQPEAARTLAEAL